MRDLTLRERRLVGLLAIGLPGLLIWQMVLTPALDLRSRSLDRIARVEAVFAYLDRLPDGLLDASAPALPPLRQRVTETARSAGLDIRRLDPQGAALSVALDAVAFADLVGWLDHLTGSHGVRILSVEIGRRPEPGIVSARLVLEAAR